MRVFIGSYTQMITEDFGGSGLGIYSMTLDPGNGQLELHHVQRSINPSYLAIDPYLEILYCIKEVAASDSPLISAYRIEKDQSLTLINSREVHGALPCHILWHKNNLYVACYATGNVLAYPLDQDGSILPCSQNYQHQGGVANSLRQEAPHAHQVCLHPNEKEFYVPDLGIDCLKAYQLDSSQFLPNPKLDVSLPAGGGPRHMVFTRTGDLAFVINELTAEISVVKKSENGFKFIKSLGSLPKDYVGTPSASAIRLHPSGKYLYAGNRGSETIAIFEVKDEDINLKELIRVEGKTIREFNISPDGKWLLVACQDSHDLISYALSKNGSLNETFRTNAVSSPVCILFQ